MKANWDEVDAMFKAHSARMNEAADAIIGVLRERGFTYAEAEKALVTARFNLKQAMERALI